MPQLPTVLSTSSTPHSLPFPSTVSVSTPYPSSTTTLSPTDATLSGTILSCASVTPLGCEAAVRRRSSLCLIAPGSDGTPTPVESRRVVEVEPKPLCGPLSGRQVVVAAVQSLQLTIGGVELTPRVRAAIAALNSAVRASSQESVVKVGRLFLTTAALHALAFLICCPPLLVCFSLAVNCPLK